MKIEITQDNGLLHKWKKYFYSNEEYLKHCVENATNYSIKDLYNLKIEEDNNSSSSVELNQLINSMEKDIKLPLQFQNQVPIFKKFINKFIGIIYKKLLSEDVFKENNKIDSTQIIISILEHAEIVLHNVFQKTLVLELNILRESKGLKGENADERYTYYEETFLKKNENVQYILEKYPHLAILIYRKIEHILQFSTEVLSHALNDWQEIQTVFMESSPKLFLENIDFMAGDSHNKGKTVCIFSFNTKKLVYKPRSLEIDVKYQVITEYINKSRADLPTIYAPKVIQKGTYGWSEFITYEECNDNSQIHRFYTRLGMQLGILYVLNATDFHYENIIAHNEYPILVDLETLFHQDVKLEKNETALEKADRLLQQSVMASGMLPNMIYQRHGKHKGIDLSAINARGKQEIPNGVTKLRDIGTENMRYEKSQAYLEEGTNLPKLNSEFVDIKDYLEDILYGFKEVYNLVAQNKEQIIDFIHSCSDVEVRTILKSTSIYSEHLAGLLHPELLKSPVESYVFLNRINLLRYKNPEQFPVIESEIEDLFNLDIPMFKVKIGSKDLIGTSHIYKDFFEESAKDQVISKINRMSEEDLVQQLQVINMAMLAVNASEFAEYRPLNTDANSIDMVPDEKFIIMAEEIGQYLMDSAIESKITNDITWISTVLEGNNEIAWMIAPVGLDFYNGNSGIALFFATLYTSTKKEIYKEYTYKALKPILNNFEQYDDNPRWSLGLYSGVGGGIYTIYIIGKMFEDEELKNKVLQHLQAYRQMIVNDTIFDVVGGSAGAVLMLLDLYEKSSINDFLSVAIEAAEHLYENVHHINENEVGWISVNVNEPLTGYSHGNAGILAALAAIQSYHEHKDFDEVMRKGLNFERNYYSEEEKNWHTPGRENSANAWCHGAPGILLSRLKLHRYGYTDSFIEQEIQIALETTLKNGFGNNRSHCHGDYGQIEILNYANNLLQLDELEKVSTSINIQLFNLYKAEGWKSGVSRGTDAKGLLVGIAGIGMGLLQKVNPNLVNIITI